MATRTNDLALTRRRLLAAAPLGLWALGRTGSARAAARLQKRPLAVQLYSVRDALAKDFEGTLKQVAAMGFDGVEFAGYHKFKEDPQGLRKLLDSLKLKVAGTHIGAGSFAPDKIKQTIEFHKTIGCKFLIVPGDGRFTDPEKSKEYAKVITDAAAALKPHGLFCGHHNHTGEFKKEGDKTYWDLFAERTSKDVILQLDIGWATVAGLDPDVLIRRYPGRIKTAHFKAKLPPGTQGKKPIIGQDVTDWKKVIAACTSVGGTQWFTLEQEDYPDGLSPIESVRASLDGLKKILSGASA